MIVTAPSYVSVILQGALYIDLEAERGLACTFHEERHDDLEADRGLACTFHEERHDDLEAVLLCSQNQGRHLVGKLIVVGGAADHV